MNLRTYFLSLVLAALHVPAPLCRPADFPDERVLARAGDIFISEREFLERFELTPGLYRHRKAGLELAKQEFLLSLIAEKLLVQEAVSRGLDRDSSGRLAVEEVTRMFARDELYRREISGKTTVSESEISAGMQKARRTRRVRFIFTGSEEESEFLRDRMTTGEDLRDLSIDSSLAAIRDTATVAWGDADPVIEEAAYTLVPGQVSPPVGAGDGWYILTLLDESPNASVETLPASTLRSRVERTLRSRKELRRMGEFLRELQKLHAVYSPGPVFSALARTLGDVMAAEGEILSPSSARRVRSLLREQLTDTVLVAGKKTWTVAETIDRLEAAGFVVAGDARRRAGRRLFEAFHEWTQKAITEEEALRRGLDRLPEVQRAVKPWRDAMLAARLKGALGNLAAVSEADVAAYMRTLDSSWRVPTVRIRELRTSSLQEMRSAFTALEQGEAFEDVIRRFGSDPRVRDTGGLSEPFPVYERRPIGEIAWRLEPGERHGPLRDSAGVLLFELVEKTNPAPDGDSARVAAAGAELRTMKHRRVETLFIAQAAARRGFDVYQERLSSLTVSPVPMVTFRFLGFGGRMFAVPFVDPQLEWLNVETPQEILLP